MEKIDFKKKWKALYQPPSRHPVILDIPRMNFLMIDGRGDPGTSQEYIDAVSTLYSLSYALKFMLKKMEIIEYGVPPLEGLWWSDDMDAFTNGSRDLWQWTSMIMQPDQVAGELVTEASAQVRKKKNPAGLSKVRFESFHEGRCAQVMHLGPYADEGPTIEGLHAFIAEKGYLPCGKHHELYLSDPGRTKPEKLKTVIRQPMEDPNR